MGLINTALAFPFPLLSTDLIIAIYVAGKVHSIPIICFIGFKENTHRSHQYESVIFPNELHGKKLRIKILFKEIVPPSHYALSVPGQKWKTGTHKQDVHAGFPIRFVFRRKGCTTDQMSHCSGEIKTVI